ncbi:hypothetical protein [Rhodoferax saidenbachensis]|uniref:Uncharacterized protein n=1 Tax=Rhodoferax saidenbachensis TaxID=1484693 RepID=A0ABU1ZLT9_9BURK|nr:hypothetical protein [Rhodoferax saidenbachensis]MDR7306501.1 hypothetical protein [Rhodoferax saidenbachensis]
MATDAALLRFSFSDSEVLCLACAGPTVTVHFSAAWVQRRLPGAAPLTGYVRGLQMQLQGVPEGAAVDAMGRLRDGRVLLASTGAGLTQLDIPGRWQEPLTLELDFAQGASLRWQATQLVCTLQQGWDFQESLAC